MADDFSLSTIAARLAGHAWDDIKDFVGAGNEQALNAGYTQDEVDQYLGRNSPNGLMDQLDASWRVRLANDPDMGKGVREDVGPLAPLEGLSAARVAGYASAPVPTAEDIVPGEPVDYNAPPLPIDDKDMRANYADALNSGSVRSAQDFAERYAGSLLGAVGSSVEAVAHGVREASRLASQLPTDEQFTDTAIGLAGQLGVELTPSAVAALKDNLVKDWAATGTPPMEQFKQAAVDSQYAQTLVSPPRQDDEVPLDVQEAVAASGLAVEVAERMGVGVRDVAGGATQMAAKLLPSGFVDAVNDLNNHLVDLGVPLAQVPPEGLDFMEKERLKQTGPLDNDWLRTVGQVAATLPMYTTLGLEGAWGLIAAGASGGAASAAFLPSTAEDYWTEKAKGAVEQGVIGAGLGGALGLLGKAIGAMSPRAAAMFADAVRDTPEPKVPVLMADGAIEQKLISEAVKPPGPATPVSSEAGKLVVAIRTPEGEIIAGRPGEIHADLMDKYDALHPNTFESIDPGFIDEHGNFLNREEALAHVGPQDRAGFETEGAFYRAFPGEVGGGLDSAEAHQRGVLAEPVLPPEAQPAEKLAALTRNDVGGSNIEVLAKDQDPATQELARSADGASSIGSFLKDTMSRLMADESGSLRLRTPQQVQAAADRAGGRDYLREAVIRNMVGNATRDVAHFADMLEPSWRPIAQNLGEWEREIAKGPGGNPMGTPIGTMLDYVEGRSAGAHIDPNSPLKPVADVIRDINQAVDARLRAQANAGTITYEGYIKDYYPHVWEDPAQVRADFGSTGKFGSRANLQERTTFPTLSDGLRAGYVPKNTNPIEAVLADVQAKMLYSHAADMIEEASNAGHVYWSRAPKDAGDMRINGGIGTKYRPIPGQNGAPTVLQEVHAYANEGFARNLNDWLSRGLYDRPATASALDKIMYAKNVSTAFKLSLPLFHSQTVAIGSLASGIGQGLEEVARGQFGRAFLNLGESATIVPNLVHNAVVGQRAIRNYVENSNDPVIKALTEAGLSFTKPLAPEAGYSFGTNSVYTSLRRGTLGREVAKDIKDIGGNPRIEEAAYRALRVPDRILQFGIKEAGRLMSSVTAPVFDGLIPMLKVGASYRRVQSFLEANPTASADVVSRYARQAAMDVDNRLGELNLDTVFWPKAAKQAVNAATISTSWAYGTYRGLLSALGYNVERRAAEFNPIATTSLIGTAMAYTYANAIVQYLHTGQTPIDTSTPYSDFLNYRTGEMTKTGREPERGMIPSELKELYDLAKVAMKSMGQPSDFFHAMLEYSSAKANPFMQVLFALGSGKDGLGHDIANMPGGWDRFFKENFMPIFAQQLDDRRKGTGVSKVENVLGEREAAKFVEDPAGYFSDLEKQRAKSQKAEALRYKYEQALKENPDEEWGKVDDVLAAANKRAEDAGVRKPKKALPEGVVPTPGNKQSRRPAGAPIPRSRRSSYNRRVGGGAQGVRGGYQGVGGGAQGV